MNGQRECYTDATLTTLSPPPSPHLHLHLHLRLRLHTYLPQASGLRERVLDLERQLGEAARAESRQQEWHEQVSCMC